jgi:tetratricopeptide (TPR) repeat protein
MRRMPTRTPRSGGALAMTVAWVMAVALPMVVSLGCAGVPNPPAARPALGDHSFRITTTSAQAQAAFDRGLTLAYGFSHEAAIEEFRKAAEIDPGCAMAYWGIALVNGPHINFPLVPPDKAKSAWEALTRARALAPRAGAVEQELIAALAKRYAENQPEDRRPLDEAYAAAMRDVWKAHPKDADVATLFAESMMDLRPWDLFTKDGAPQPGTEEILATLEAALSLDPLHPGANHLYIHAVEASPHPEKGIAAADRLRDLVPGISHLVHMPSHIDARVGQWAQATQANVRAMSADAAYRAAHPRPGFHGMYMAHNDHFYAFAAMMQGQSAEALKAAQAMVHTIPEDFLRDYAGVADGHMPFVSEVLMRFGRWDDVLAEEAPPKNMPIANALWRFTRAVSLTALGRTGEADAEREEFGRAVAAVPAAATFGNNPAALLLDIATRTLDGERAAKKNDFGTAVRLLREAATLEDGLRYDEPPDWIQPVRHTLGAVLLRAGRPADAEAVYREDLVRYPENGWSLWGLERALRLQKKDAEADAMKKRFDAIWSRADVTIGSSCLCQPGV